MRCSCPECGTYMAHSESMTLGCVCPECGARCTACLGTNTVISREELLRWKNDAVTENLLLDKIRQDEERGDAMFDEAPTNDDEDRWRG